METIVPESDFCLPETWSTFKDNVQRIDTLFGNADAIWCNIDEWRVAGWNDKCEAFEFKTSGEYMAKSWQGIESLLRSTGNGCRSVIVWNDMLDPYHNAWEGPYGMVFGNTCYGSYKGLSHKTIINNWNVNAKAQSLRFFGGLDPKYPEVKCRQLVNSMYPSDAYSWDKLLTEAEKDGVDNVVGMSWVTWFSDFTQIIPTANAYKAVGRWGTNPFPVETCDPIPPAIENNAAPANVTSMAALRVTSRPGKIADIHCSVSKRGLVELAVFNLHGRRIQTLVNAHRSVGSHVAAWNTSNLAPGVYFLQLDVDGISHRIIKQTML